MKRTTASRAAVASNIDSTLPYRAIALPVISLLMLCHAGTALAASNADLKITGVIRPGSCALTISAGGVVNYGTIARTDLSANAPTALAEKSIAFVINCGDSASKTALKLTDNRGATAVNGIIQTVESTLGDRAAFGLGSVNNKNLGAYSVQIYAVTGENALTTSYHRTDGSTNWLKNTQIANHYFTGDQKSWGISDVSGPSAFKKVSGHLNIRAVIDKLSNLPAGDEIQLNGSSTLEFIYL